MTSGIRKINKWLIYEVRMTITFDTVHDPYVTIRYVDPRDERRTEFGNYGRYGTTKSLVIGIEPGT